MHSNYMKLQSQTDFKCNFNFSMTWTVFSMINFHCNSTLIYLLISFSLILHRWRNKCTSETTTKCVKVKLAKEETKWISYLLVFVVVVAVFAVCDWHSIFTVNIVEWQIKRCVFRHVIIQNNLQNLNSKRSTQNWVICLMIFLTHFFSLKYNFSTWNFFYRQFRWTVNLFDCWTFYHQRPSHITFCSSDLIVDSFESFQFKMIAFRRFAFMFQFRFLFIQFIIILYLILIFKSILFADLMKTRK